MLTEKDDCDYETCVALREVGCRIQTEWYIHQPSYERGSCYLCFGIPRETSVLDECDYIPLLSLYEAQKWLREEKEFYVFVGREWENTYYYWISKKFGDKTEGITHSFYYPNGEGQFSSYEEALSEGIKEAVKILKEK